MSNVLNTGVRNARNVGRYIFGPGSISELGDILSRKRVSPNDSVIYFLDEYFNNNPNSLGNLPFEQGDQLIYISTEEEPTTQYVNDLFTHTISPHHGTPCALVGIGGGVTLDVTKAISNLLTNGGHAEDYQGWDLVRRPGIYKVGIPTLSGTGAEATRTCVITNKDSGLKLGMNSDYTVYDQLILDPKLTATVPRDQYFFTGMDAWIHSVEALNGSYRNPVGDAFSAQAIQLCEEVFNSNEMMSDANREKMMVASYLGGVAIATTYVGVVHPFSAGLSVVLGLHHCISNCITMSHMEMFYPDEYRTFMSMIDRQAIYLPQGVCADLSDDQYHQLYQATIVHEKPLTNALGERFQETLTEEKVRSIFERI